MKKYHLPLMPVIWGVTCLIIAGLVALGLYSYYSAEKKMAEQFNQQQLKLARQAAQTMEIFLADLRQNMALLAGSPEARKLNGKSGGDKILESFYQGIREEIDFVLWVDSRGALKSSYPAAPADTLSHLDLSPYFREARGTGRPVLAHLLSSPPDKSPPPLFPPFGVLLIVAPVFQGEECVGALACLLDFTGFYERFFQPVLFGERAESWMIDREGKFICHYDPTVLGKDAFQVRKERDPEVSPQRIDRIMKEGMLAGKSGMDQYESGWHIGGRGRIKKLIAYAPVRLDQDRFWSVALVVPYSEVTKVVWGSFRNSAVLIAFMAFVLLGGTYLGHKINQERTRAEEKGKWAEEILRTQGRLQALFDGAPDAIGIVDRDYRVLMINKTALNWYQKPAEDFVGKTCHWEFQGREDLCPNCPAEESFRTGRPAFREKASLVAGGNKYYLQLFTFPLRDAAGEVAEVVEYVKDVTAEKELQRQIIHSERLAVVGRMSANVAHEIKNPLGTIVLNAELLEEELRRLGTSEPAEALELLSVIKSEIDRLIEVVEEYLQFARLPVVKLETGQVNEVVGDLLSFFKEEIAERKIFLVEELDPQLPPVLLDAKQLRQALLNVIKNSFEAMPEGGKLTVSTAQKGGRVEISIGDTGKGIEEENQDLIFTPFFSTKHGGTGLGLSITSHIVKEHRGTITFQSYAEMGTVFTIRLPLLPFPGLEERREEKAQPLGV